MGPEEYYIVKQRALPEVLLKVVEAKHRLACDASLTVQEVTDAIGLSRSSFYKYRDDIVPFHENSRGKTLNIMLQVDDRQGVLSAILQQIAGQKGNWFLVHCYALHRQISVMVSIGHCIKKALTFVSAFSFVEHTGVGPVTS